MKEKLITAVVLTKNEERNLATCLGHLTWVDDLVIVDSGSTDNTFSIAGQYHARIFVNVVEKFIIADQRNWALDNAQIKTPWVLFIDADEVVTDELANAVRVAIMEAPPTVAAFQLCYKFMFLGRWLKYTMRFPSWHDRLIRFQQTRFKGEVWECFDTQGEIRKIVEPYLHYAFNNGLDAWIARHQRYAAWKASQILKKRASKDVSFVEILREIFIGDNRARRAALELLASHCLCISPFLRFMHYYFLRCGFLDGKAGFVYARMMAMYQLMIYINVLEQEQRGKNLEF